MNTFTPTVIGHIDNVTTLNRLLDHKTLPQAMVFSGEKGLGKRTLALNVAGYLADPEKYGQNPQSFSAFLGQNAHPHVLVIQDEEEGGAIDVERVRQARTFFHMTAVNHQWRVLIVDSVDQLNRFGLNALLKTVEEPPHKSLVILINHNRARLLPTLRSRVHMMSFHDLSPEDMETLSPSLMDPALKPFIGGNPGRFYDFQKEDNRTFCLEVVALCENLLMNKAIDQIWPFLRTWFADVDKAEKRWRLHMLAHVLLQLEPTSPHLRQKVWQANDTLMQNMDDHHVYHLDLQAFLCHTLGHLVYGVS